VLDTQANTPTGARVIAQDSPAECIIVAGPSAPETRCRALEAAGATVLRQAEVDGRLDLEATLRALAERGALAVLCEGGPTVATALIEGRLADRIVLFIAPKVIGGREALTAVEGGGVGELAEAWQLRFDRVRRVGEDIMIEARPCSPD
jgi:diaminohydroxyphosphoribosylaminopyrimidine deaminase/5-amino-6-(5-phosphoribosylamino)uracil reductase